MASNIHNDHILYSCTASLPELTSLICSVNRVKEQDNSAISDFHLQILKSRMLIFSVPQLIVSPHIANIGEIVVIFHRKGLDIKKLQSTVKRFNIKVLRSEEVSIASLEACYRYSLGARLAPLWNLVGSDLYVAGRDFLTSYAPADAVTLSVHVARDIITLNVKCHKVRMGQLHLEDFNLTPKDLEYFISESDASLTEASLLDQWVHVLPSLKKGRIINIYKQMPKSSAFKSYKELKRHWKNIYGYRLPESDADLLYCEIHFRPSPRLYTYPFPCLRPFTPLLSAPLDQKRILENLLRDLKIQIPTVLGQSTDFVPSAGLSQLSAASHPISDQ